MSIPLLLKTVRAPREIVVDVPDLSDDGELNGIRCPVCAWRPSASSEWCCVWTDGPEPFFAACGTVWNTFATAAVCPGCRHQWQWTSCLRCGEWSPHADWYEEPDG
jgi:hypothetical protein